MVRTIHAPLLEPIHKDNRRSKPSFFLRMWRVLYDAARGFIEDDCYAKASALTFYTLLSVVPVLAVLFGIAKGFGFERTLEVQISEQFPEQQEIMDKLIQFAYSWLSTVQGGLIAGVGAILLFWTVFGLLNNIETTLNSIWKTRFARPYSRKISDYLATMLVAPIFIVTSISINLFIHTQITAGARNYAIVQAVSPLLIFGLKLFPYFLSWILFTFVYLFMPNTKVYLRSAIIAGIIAGTIFQIWQWIYFTFQIGAASYGAIYGSFAALPLFLIWLQFSWMILLVGAEIAVEVENDLFIPLRTLNPLSPKAAALLITYRCIEAFVENRAALTDHALARELGMSLNHVHIILETLQNEHIISEVSFADKMYGYQPARAIQSITMKTVCDAIDKSNELQASYLESPEMMRIQGYLREVEEEMGNPKINHVLYVPEEVEKYVIKENKS